MVADHSCKSETLGTLSCTVCALQTRLCFCQGRRNPDRRPHGAVNTGSQASRLPPHVPGRPCSRSLREPRPNHGELHLNPCMHANVSEKKPDGLALMQHRPCCEKSEVISRVPRGQMSCRATPISDCTKKVGVVARDCRKMQKQTLISSVPNTRFCAPVQAATKLSGAALIPQPPLATTAAEVAALDSLRAQMSQYAATNSHGHSLRGASGPEWQSSGEGLKYDVLLGCKMLIVSMHIHYFGMRPSLPSCLVYLACCLSLIGSGGALITMPDHCAVLSALLDLSVKNMSMRCVRCEGHPELGSWRRQGQPQNQVHPPFHSPRSLLGKPPCAPHQS